MNNEPPAAAVARAQHWLRTLTKHELQQWEEVNGQLADEKRHSVETGLSTVPIEEEVFEEKRAPDSSDLLDDSVNQRHGQQNADLNIHRYAHPIYWAGFQIIGW